MTVIKGLVERIEKESIELNLGKGITSHYAGYKIKIRTRNDWVYVDLPIVLDQNCIQSLIRKEVEYTCTEDIEGKIVGPGIHYRLKCGTFDVNKFIPYTCHNQ